MQSRGINLKWMGISILIFGLVQLILIILSPFFLLITLGLGIFFFGLIKLAGYFLGGFLTGVLSPGITLIEPAIGAVLAVVIGSFINSGKHHSGLVMIIISVAAFALALAGAKLGEKASGNRV